MTTNKTLIGTTLIVGGLGSLAAYGFSSSAEIGEWFKGLTTFEIDQDSLSSEKLAKMLSTSLLNSNLPKVPQAIKSQKKVSESLREIAQKARDFQTKNRCNYYFYFDKNRKTLDDVSLTEREKTIASIIFMKQAKEGQGKCISGKDVIFKKLEANRWEISYISK